MMKADKTMNLARVEPKDTIPSKKFKFPPSNYHFPFTYQNRDFFLLVGTTMAHILEFRQEQLYLLKHVEIPKNIEVLDFSSLGNGDITILHQNGLYRQYVDRLLKNQPFRAHQFEEVLKPKRIQPTESGILIVVCEGNKLAFLKKDKVFKVMDFPSIMLMEKMVVDYHKKSPEEACLIVPSKKEHYPFVFSLRELQIWEKQGYLSESCKQVEKYYEEDEVLNNTYCCIGFNSAKNIVYACSKDQICILAVKKTKNEHYDFILETHIKIQKNWNSPPFFTSISKQKGTAVLIGRENILEFDFNVQKGYSLKIKQKDDPKRMIRAGYVLQEHYFVFLTNLPEDTRMGVVCLNKS